ncbi:MAG: hypothetical protein EOP38_08735 [Rubrivivax sp.]|nr:MAG: hypothetical protein EOP38_08735 [Rubrivivax sp.]
MNSHRFMAAALLLPAFTVFGQSAEESTSLFLKKKGAEPLATMAVDTAPGNVSALAMAGLSGEQVSPIENPGDLTVALKAIDRSNNFGVSITPARTSLLPLSVSAYNDSALARVWANTTFSFAQATANVEDKDYRQRAYSVETSYFIDAEQDDPLIVYWNHIKAAALKPEDASNPCLNFVAQAPAQPVPPTALDASPAVAGPTTPKPGEDTFKEASDRRAADCRRIALDSARWNASRVWASWATGSYRAAVASNGSHSLGRTLVLGGTHGIGRVGARMPAAITLAFKRSLDEPVLSTFDTATPTRRNVNLLVLRVSAGSSRLRALLEASNMNNDDPTASERTYKRALGLDAKLAEGWWLNLRFGKQRRVDNLGDETGSSLSLSYSPKALLSF